MARQTHPSTLPIILIYGWLAASLSLWFFAFYNTASSTPDWLTRAQAVCFGTGINGLPEPYGWMVLILSPLLFLTAIVAGFKQDLERGFGGMAKNTPGKIVMLITFSLVAYHVYWIGKKIQTGVEIERAFLFNYQSEFLSPDYPRTDTPAPHFELVDQYGRQGGIQNFKGSPALLTFAFAHCQTMCPAILGEIHKARSELKNKLPLLIVSLDPWRDTPTSLSTIAKSWELDEKTHYYSGTPELVEAITRAYNMPSARDTISGDITHPAMVYVIDAKGNIGYTLNNPNHRFITDAIARL